MPRTRVFLQAEQGSSPCDRAHKAHRAGVVTCVVFLPVKNIFNQEFLPAPPPVGEDMGSPALSLGLGEEKSSPVTSLSSSALL